MNICEHLTVTARIFPDREAIQFEGHRFTFAQLDRLSIAAAKQLIEAGIVPGDRVALVLPNVPAFVVWYYATLRVGAVAVSLSTRLTGSEVAFLVNDCQARAMVTVDAAAEGSRPDLPECLSQTFLVSDLGDRCDGRPLVIDGGTPSSWVETEPNSAAVILYTSGTTGFAKGATLSHRNVRSNVHAFNHLCNMTPDDRMLLAVPLFHCFGQNALLNSAFNVGATLVLQRQFDLSEAKRLIDEQQVTQLYGVPMMFQLLLDRCDSTDLPAVNYCFSAAATLPIQIANRWQEKFRLPIHEGYGLTETSPFASYNHAVNFVPGSIGMPIDMVEMKIVDTESGETCRPGELGEIAIRGPNVMLGYWNRPADTEQTIRDGWFHSGDVGRVDQRGYYYIVDRVKDMIAVGGLKVYPAEVERVLLDHVAIEQVAVVGFPDDLFGEQVIAFVVLTGDSGAAETALNDINEHAKESLANYKAPRKLVVLDDLPRNPSGKVLKTELRKFDLSNESSGSDQPVAVTDADPQRPSAIQEFRPPTLRDELAATHLANRTRVAHQFLQQLVQELSDAEESPEVDARFLDCGLDSLRIVEMSRQLQVELGPEHDIPATLLFDYPRICDLSDYLIEILCPTEAETDSPSGWEGPPENVAGLPDPDSHDSPDPSIESMTEEQALAELLKELDD